MSTRTGGTLGDISQTDRAAAVELPVDALPAKQRRAYLMVEAWLRANSGKSVATFFKAHRGDKRIDFSDATYYIAKKRMEQANGGWSSRDMIRPGDKILKSVARDEIGNEYVMRPAIKPPVRTDEAAKPEVSPTPAWLTPEVRARQIERTAADLRFEVDPAAVAAAIAGEEGGIGERSEEGIGERSADHAKEAPPPTAPPLREATRRRLAAAPVDRDAPPHVTAFAKLHAILEPLTAVHQARAIRAVMAILGLDGVEDPAPATE